MKKYVLRDLINVKRGMSLSGEYYATEGQLIRLTLGNFQEEGGFKLNTSKDDLFFTGAVRDEFILNKGDIITPLTEQVVGLLGATARIPESGKYIQSGDVALVKCISDELDDGYCYYLISSALVRRQLSIAAQQTKIRHTSPEKIMDCEVFIPEVNEQKKIAKLLDSINKKIELNNKINDNLQQQIDTIYDYWFLQYQFPDINGRPNISSSEHNETTGSGVNKLPAGWKKIQLCQIEGNIITGKTPSTSDRSNYGADIPFITIGDIRNNKYVVSTDISLSTKGADSQKNKYIPADSLCVTCIASPGIIGFSTEPSQTNQQINTIVFSNDINKEFLYCALRKYFTQQGVVKTGNTFANMNKDDFSQIPIVYPDLKTLESFHQITMPLASQMKVLSLQNKYLIGLRIWLLPLLMSGQAAIAD